MRVQEWRCYQELVGVVVVVVACFDKRAIGGVDGKRAAHFELSSCKCVECKESRSVKRRVSERFKSLGVEAAYVLLGAFAVVDEVLAAELVDLATLDLELRWHALADERLQARRRFHCRRALLLLHPAQHGRALGVRRCGRRSVVFIATRRYCCCCCFD